MFCSSPSLCVPLFIVPTKRLRLPCVLFICECAFVYCASKETQTALCFVIYLSVPLFIMSTSKEDSDYPVFPSSSDCPVFRYLSLSVPLFIMPAKRLRLPCVLFFFISVCRCLSYQRGDSDCPIFCCSSLYVPLFIAMYSEFYIYIYIYLFLQHLHFVLSQAYGVGFVHRICISGYWSCK